MLPELALYQPEIAPNTGNIMRLCANVGTKLHLIHPLGFVLSDKNLRRAHLDYLSRPQEHADYVHFLSAMENRRIIAFSTHAKENYAALRFAPSDVLLFGPETRGLPTEIRNSHTAVRIPMVHGSRSMNLSNACAVALFEAWRQLGFEGS